MIDLSNNEHGGNRINYNNNNNNNNDNGSEIKRPSQIAFKQQPPPQHSQFIDIDDDDEFLHGNANDSGIIPSLQTTTNMNDDENYGDIDEPPRRKNKRKRRLCEMNEDTDHERGQENEYDQMINYDNNGGRGNFVMDETMDSVIAESLQFDEYSGLNLSVSF